MFSSKKMSCMNVQERDPSLEDLEIRPGGMLVQKRNSVLFQSCASIPNNIRVRVKYGSSYHDIFISSQASFGELKKKLSGSTRVHPQDQKLIYKNKERDSKAYLDVTKVKDGSKMVLVEDIVSKEKRCLEMLRNSKVVKALNSLEDINLELHKLGDQVGALESTASSEDEEIKKEMDVENLTEMLMTKLIELEGINVADGDLKLQRRAQVSRVQKYIEALDLLKLKNTKCSSMKGKLLAHTQRQESSIGKDSKPVKRNFGDHMPVLQSDSKPSPSIVLTTKWETFD